MDIKVINFLAAFAAALACTSCLNLSQSSDRSAPSGGLNQRFNFFDVELMRYSAEAIQGNFMVSPASVKSVLAMLLEGAMGNCADELRRALRLPGDPQEMRDQLNNFLATLKILTPGIVLENANRIFLSNRHNVLKKYRKLLNDIYYSDIQTVDFDDPDGTAAYINNWISKQTYGLIEHIIDPFNIESTAVLVLANALYFKGVWENSFEKNETHLQCFRTEAGCKDVYMMENQGDFNYGFISELNAQAIEFPYVGNRYSMLVLLPKERNGVSALIKDLPFVSLPQIFNQMDLSDVQVSLPRFTIDFSEDLVAILRNIGINIIFTPSSNLTGIVQGDISPLVNNIFHKTRIEVNEEGSVAAAGTGAMVIPLMGSSTARFLADHPFLFFIRDVKTGAVLFEGRVDEPDLATTQTQKPAPLSPAKPIAERPGVPQKPYPSIDYDTISELLGTNQNNQQQSRPQSNPPASQNQPQSYPAQTRPIQQQLNQQQSNPTQTRPSQQQSNPTQIRPSQQQSNPTQTRPSQQQSNPTQVNNDQPHGFTSQQSPSRVSQSQGQNIAPQQNPLQSNNQAAPPKVVQYLPASVNQIAQPVNTNPNSPYSSQAGKHEEALGTADRFANDDDAQMQLIAFTSMDPVSFHSTYHDNHLAVNHPHVYPRYHPYALDPHYHLTYLQSNALSADSNEIDALQSAYGYAYYPSIVPDNTNYLQAQDLFDSQFQQPVPKDRDGIRFKKQ